MWIERSLGGNVRLVWTFPRPVMVETYDFCVFFLEQCRKWLSLDLLPGLDEGALTDPNRLLCNGGEWISTGHGDVPAAKLQSFFVKCAREFKMGAVDVVIPLDTVEAALKVKYSNFSWPGPFEAETQGPSFWIEGSESPLSAILKKEGMFTFSAHATKAFYSWAELLGNEFVKDFSDNAMTKATEDVWWDGRHFWRKVGGIYVSCEGTEMTNVFKVDCKLSSKPGKEGVSMLDQALNHIYTHNRIFGSAPFVFQQPGLIYFMGKRRLNTWSNLVKKPADEWTPWGAEGKFAPLCAMLEALFDPPEQLWYWLAWWKYFYMSGLSLTPRPGQNCFLCGGAGTGKTFTNRELVGWSVGGFADAASYLVRGGSFNSHLFEAALWALDDDTPSGDQEILHAMLKKTAANQTSPHNKKFEVDCMVAWSGRVIVTTNLDFISTKMLGPMDNTSMDKTSIFRCAAKTKFQFPPWGEMTRIRDDCMPYLLRWLVDWEVPAHIARDPRFGFASYHESSLLDQTRQASKAAPFKELLIEALNTYFEMNPTEDAFRGTVTQVIKLITSNPLNDYVVRSLRMEQTARYLEMIQREGLFRCAVETGENKMRIWVFYRTPKN